MIPVYFSLTYTSNLQGSAFKSVQCEKCHHEFVYCMTIQVQGQGTSLYALDNQGARERAQTRAEEKLTRELEIGEAPVPCPSCGVYQHSMIPWARATKHAWMKRWGL